MKCFVSFSCLLGVLSALSFTVTSSAVAQQFEPRGAERNEGAKYNEQLRRNEQTNIDGIDAQSAPGHQGRDRLSQEERRQLRRDINAAGRDIYRRDRSERPNR